MDNYGRCFIHEISLDLFVKETKNQKKVSKARLLLHLFLLIQLSLAQDSALLFLCQLCFSSQDALPSRKDLAQNRQDPGEKSLPIPLQRHSQSPRSLFVLVRQGHLLPLPRLGKMAVPLFSQVPWTLFVMCCHP
jgi:hypothetical protein